MQDNIDIQINWVLEELQIENMAALEELQIDKTDYIELSVKHFIYFLHVLMDITNW